MYQQNTKHTHAQQEGEKRTRISNVIALAKNGKMREMEEGRKEGRERDLDVVFRRDEMKPGTGKCGAQTQVFSAGTSWISCSS